MTEPHYTIIELILTHLSKHTLISSANCTDNVLTLILEGLDEPLRLTVLDCTLVKDWVLYTFPKESAILVTFTAEESNQLSNLLGGWDKVISNRIYPIPLIGVIRSINSKLLYYYNFIKNDKKKSLQTQSVRNIDLVIEKGYRTKHQSQKKEVSLPSYEGRGSRTWLIAYHKYNLNPLDIWGVDYYIIYGMLSLVKDCNLESHIHYLVCDNLVDVVYI
jgi:hypothetical protein